MSLTIKFSAGPKTASFIVKTALHISQRMVLQLGILTAIFIEIMALLLKAPMDRKKLNEKLQSNLKQKPIIKRGKI